MSRGGVNLTEQEWAEITRPQKGGDALRPISTHLGQNMAPSKAKGGASKMNRWEQEYALELEARRQAREILWWGFEAIKLKLTGRTFYTPDFVVVHMFNCGVPSFVEIKGFLRDDANVKFKVAAELFPWAEFSMYRKRKVSEGGGWELMKHLNGGAR